MSNNRTTISEVNSLRDACSWFKQHNPNAKEVGEIHGSKGPICNIFVDGSRRRYYIMFKRDWLHSFAYLFKKPGAGYGQTVNMRILNQAAKYQFDTNNETLLIAVMPKAAYSIDALTMLNYVITNNTTRTPSTEYDEEGSCPSKMWAAHIVD